MPLHNAMALRSNGLRDTVAFGEVLAHAAASARPTQHSSELRCDGQGGNCQE